jgi:hypothetical protein
MIVATIATPRFTQAMCQIKRMGNYRTKSAQGSCAKSPPQEINAEMQGRDALVLHQCGTDLL